MALGRFACNRTAMFRPALKRAVTDPLLGVCVGGAFGAWTEFSPKYVLGIAAFVGIGRFAMIVGTEVQRQRARRARSHSMHALRDPDPDAAVLAAKRGHKEPVVGKVIEIWAHPSLESLLPMWDVGLEPRVVRIDKPVPKNFDHAISRSGGLKEFPPPNERKFGILRLPTGVTDDADFRVSVYETDWNTYRTVRDAIEANADLRHELSHVAPEQSLVPQSTALHFLIRFRDGKC